jgi:glycosyltransferase involved in cell wall biosynthesis
MKNKESHPLVSVLMTAYNREKYIAEAIESVMASTYQNWELIIVDDQSKDQTVEIARSYEAKDDRIKVYINEKNLGDYPNRNKAASYAKGKYLKFVDADDMIYPYGLEQLVFYMEQFPDASYGLCSLEQDKSRIFPFQLSPKEAYKRHYFEESLFHKAPLSAIIKKDAFELVGGFSGKQHLGDFEMWHSLSQKFPVVLMPHGIGWYREHEEQQMNDNLKNPFVPFKYLLLTRGLLKNQQTPLSEELGEKAYTSNERKISKSVLSAFKNHSFHKGLELKNHSGKGWFKIITEGLKK